MKHGEKRRLPLDGDVRSTGKVLDARIDVMSWNTALSRLLTWGRARESRYVVASNVHVVVTAAQDIGYREVVNGADMVTPDGMPLVWMLRRQGFTDQPRIYGPDLMEALCDRCAAEGLPVYFYGGSEATLSLLVERLRSALPALVIAGMESPPFRPLTEAEDSAVVERMNASRAGIVFVGLGCPKQERWMAQHRGRVSAVMLGVGAAFDFYAGTLRQAPSWMQNAGLEWFYRLAVEPRRLWKRYLVTNTLFVFGAARQLFLERERGRGPRA